MAAIRFSKEIPFSASTAMFLVDISLQLYREKILCQGSDAGKSRAPAVRVPATVFVPRLDQYGTDNRFRISHFPLRDALQASLLRSQWRLSQRVWWLHGLWRLQSLVARVARTVETGARSCRGEIAVCKPILARCCTTAHEGFQRGAYGVARHERNQQRCKNFLRVLHVTRHRVPPESCLCALLCRAVEAFGAT